MDINPSVGLTSLATRYRIASLGYEQALSVDSGKVRAFQGYREAAAHTIFSLYRLGHIQVVIATGMIRSLRECRLLVH